jgi:Fe-S oxidoreductase
LAENRILRRLNEAVLGLDRRRSAPRFVRQTFLKWWANHREPTNYDDRPTVALFADTFTNYYEPQHAVAAVRLAWSLGYNVVVPQRVCCGRPLISKGLLEQARTQAEATTQALIALVERGIPIVFCEPSCYSAVRDDHPQLLRGEMQERAKLVSAGCLTLEEWANLALAAGKSPPFAPGPKKILLHAHCHQKALVGTSAAVAVLSVIPGAVVTDLDAGCCGMAGLFGYEREHYDVSRAIGERKLFPAVRERGPDEVVVAPGFSCRHQIAHFTGVKAMSTAELLQRLLVGE